jgi:hypothetical protein
MSHKPKDTANIFNQTIPTNTERPQSSNRFNNSNRPADSLKRLEWNDNTKIEYNKPRTNSTEDSTKAAGGSKRTGSGLNLFQSPPKNEPVVN